MPLCGVHSSGSRTVACTISRFLKLPLRFRQYRQHACLAAYPCFLPTAFSSAVTRSRTFSSSHSVLRSSFSAKPCEPHAALRFFSFGNTIASGLFALGSACCSEACLSYMLHAVRGPQVLTKQTFCTRLQDPYVVSNRSRARHREVRPAR